MLIKKICKYFEKKNDALMEDNVKCPEIKAALYGIMEGAIDGLLIAAPILLTRVLIDNYFIKRLAEVKFHN